MRLAVVTWAIRAISSEAEFFDHMTELVESAVAQGADTVILPESIDLERTQLFGDFRVDPFINPTLEGSGHPEGEENLGVPIPSGSGQNRLSDQEIPRALAPGFDATVSHADHLSRKHGITLLAGTHLRKSERGYVNTAILATPTRTYLADKNVMTQWEETEWRIEPGSGLVAIGEPPIGIAICYDIEFPGAARALAEAGCHLIAVPSFTETIRGFHRVRRTCHARTIECQVYVAHASLVGNLGGEPVPHTYGSSAILCPSVHPFPESGILAETPAGVESIAVADLDFTLIEQGRNADDVRNWRDRDKGDWVIRNQVL